MNFCISYLEEKEVPFITVKYSFCKTALCFISSLWSHCGNGSCSMFNDSSEISNILFKQNRFSR